MFSVPATPGSMRLQGQLAAPAARPARTHQPLPRRPLLVLAAPRGRTGRLGLHLHLQQTSAAAGETTGVRITDVGGWAACVPGPQMLFSEFVCL